MTNTVMYGFNDQHYCVEYWAFDEQHDSIYWYKTTAKYLMNNNIDIRRLYVVSNRYGLREDYLESTRTGDYTEWLCFEDMISREGILVTSR